MKVAGHGLSKYRTGQLLSSSADKEWNSLLVETWRHRRGTLNEVLPEATEVVVLLSGKLHFRRRGDGKLQQGFAVPGTVWLCPAGVYESDITLSDDIAESIHAYLPNTLLEESLESSFDMDSKDVSIRYLGGFQDPLIQQVALTLRQQSACGCGDISRSLVESLSVSLYAHLLSRYSSKSSSLTHRQPSGGLGRQRLRRVDDYIDSNINGDLSLSKLAAAASLSPYHFSRTFRKTTGMSPHHYALARRIENAKLRLAHGDQSLIEISFELGFGSQSQFSRAFKRITGLTPGQYRSAVR